MRAICTILVRNKSIIAWLLMVRTPIVRTQVHIKFKVYPRYIFYVILTFVYICDKAISLAPFSSQDELIIKIRRCSMPLPWWNEGTYNSVKTLELLVFQAIQASKCWRYQTSASCNRDNRRAERSTTEYIINVRLLDETHTVKLQWLEHLWDCGHLFEIWVVRATED